MRNILQVGVTLIDQKASAWSLNDCWVCFFNIIIAESSKIKCVKVMTICDDYGRGWIV